MPKIMNDEFQKLFGYLENDYSRVIAKSLEQLRGFREAFYDFISHRLDEKGFSNLACLVRDYRNDVQEPNINTEFHFGPFGKIDIQIHHADKKQQLKKKDDQNWDGLVIGIENKIDHTITEQQLLKYWEYYNRMFHNSAVLVLLYPSYRNEIQQLDIDKYGFITMTYCDVIEVVKNVMLEANDQEAMYYQIFLRFLKKAEEHKTGVPEDQWNSEYLEIVKNILHAPGNNSGWRGSTRYFYNWNIEETWLYCDEAIKRTGLVYSAAAVASVAALEEKFNCEINTWEDFDRLYDDEMKMHTPPTKILKGKRNERGVYYLVDYILQNIGDERFCKHVREVARKLHGKPLSKSILQSMEKKEKKRKNKDVLWRERYRTELRSEYKNEAE